LHARGEVEFAECVLEPAPGAVGGAELHVQLKLPLRRGLLLLAVHARLQGLDTPIPFGKRCRHWLHGLAHGRTAPLFW
jgi:hypothetical protein